MTWVTNLWTSVTSHQAQAHPPTTVCLLVDPQHPPEHKQKGLNVSNGEIFDKNK